MIKKWIKRTLLKLGYQLKSTRGVGWHPDNLRSIGCPRTVVDVGVGFGTLPLYEAFPESFHVLVEPLDEFEGHIKSILKNYRGEHIRTAVGAREEEQQIHTEPTFPLRSSLQSRTELTATGDSAEKRRVPVTTLDALLEKRAFEPPFGLKIDTEGFECQVIEGAPGFLRKTQFVIAEVSVSPRFEDGYTFAEFVELMDQNHFALYDILQVQRPHHSRILYMDAVFTNESLQERQE